MGIAHGKLPYGMERFKPGQIIKCVKSDSRQLYRVGEEFIVENKSYLYSRVSFLNKKGLRVIGSFGIFELATPLGDNL